MELHKLCCFLLVAAIANSIECHQDPDWWKHTVIYQIYPRSLQDSDGDGVGDLRGIQSRLDYFEYLGVETLWLSPIYRSPFKDFGYDISDHKDIDPIFGTMDDFDSLLEDVHRRGMYLVMDFIPNHTSDLHPWFIESSQGTDNSYSDWYRWSDGKIDEDGTRQPPNNWLSVFGHSAWQWHEQRQQFYLHQFVPEQPDLDYRNPLVKEAMEDVLRFWTEKGVDGFRVDAIQTMFEVEDLTLDEPRSFVDGASPEEHRYLKHVHTFDQPQIHDITADWRTKVFDAIDAESGKHTFMVMETYNPNEPQEAMKYYDSGSDMPFNFYFILASSDCGGRCYKDYIDTWMRNMPEHQWPNFVLGNHDNRRVSTRKGPNYVNALNILLMTLPGTPTTYYGEEIGQNDIQVSFAATQDPWGIMAGEDLYEKYSRDPERAPMQWSADPNAGFSSGSDTWLPLNPDYTERNVEAQMNDPSGVSPLQIYRRAIQLRKKAAFQDNNRLTYHVVSDDVISFIRGTSLESFMILLNLGEWTSEQDFSTQHHKSGVVELHTGDFVRASIGAEIDLTKIVLEPGQGYVVKMVAATGKEEL